MAKQDEAKPEKARPTPGRIVNYVLNEHPRSQGRVRAAIVTGVNADDTVNLNVQLDRLDDMPAVPASYQVHREGVREGADPTDLGTWHWPIRK